MSIFKHREQEPVAPKGTGSNMIRIVVEVPGGPEVIVKRPGEIHPHDICDVLDRNEVTKPLKDINLPSSWVG